VTDDLIARLRDMQTRMIATTIPGEAADALEAQARRIAELTGNREAWKGIQEGTVRLLKEKEARIAELEAALKPMTAVVEFLLPFGDLSDEERAQWGEIIRAARAALGEK